MKKTNRPVIPVLGEERKFHTDTVGFRSAAQEVAHAQMMVCVPSRVLSTRAGPLLNKLCLQIVFPTGQVVKSGNGCPHEKCSVSTTLAFEINLFSCLSEKKHLWQHTQPSKLVASPCWAMDGPKRISMSPHCWITLSENATFQHVVLMKLHSFLLMCTCQELTVGQVWQCALHWGS